MHPGRPPCCSSNGPPHLAPSLPGRLCCLASRGIAAQKSAVPGAMRAPRSRFRCVASAAARSSSLLPLPCRIHTEVLGGVLGSGRGWVVVGCTRVFWKGGFGAVGLWCFGLAGGPLLWACVWACVGMCGHVCHACQAPQVGLRCRQVGPRVGLLHRPCQFGAGLYGACMQPLWGLCMACMGLC